MSEHSATIQWQRNQARFTDHRYSREHHWQFDGGVEVMASASPHVVPAPYSNAACIDPEEAFVAALASCHMLWFLSIAAHKQLIVDSYSDRAMGQMNKNEAGHLAITEIYLRPGVTFAAGCLVTSEELLEMHRDAHHRCFLANSVKTKITIEPVVP